MLIIFVDEISPRVLYTFDLVFKDRGIAYELTNDPFYFENSSGLKWCYSRRPFENDYLTLAPAELLFEEEIQEIQIQKAIWNEQEVLAFERNPDILASIFYVVSLYDEYLIKDVDVHGRIKAKDKTVVKLGWHRQLIVERWITYLIDYLSKQLSTDLTRKQVPFSFVPTFDIDNTYAYLYKKGVRKWLSVGRDVVKLDKQRLQERKKVVNFKQKDPYDTFEYIEQIKERGFNPILFWLFSDLSEYDRNLSHTNAFHIQLISDLAKTVEIGLHPSYKSNDVAGQLKIEKTRLEKAKGEEITKSRQHFLRMKLPFTYKNLIKEGFEHDYTLGFFDEVGFRAGLTRSFYWFDLSSNAITSLQLHPLTYMDVSLQQYLKLSPEQAKNQIDELMQEVKTYGGDFIALWHNETIGDYGVWKGWKTVLEHTLEISNTNL